MIDLKGWNEVQELTERKALPAGGYVCRILKVEITARNNRPQLKIYVDIAEGEYAGYFKKQNREQWSFNAICTRYIYDEDGKITRALKTLLLDVERSNVDFRVDVARFDEKKLVGKLVGFTFGEREYIYNAKLYTTTEIRNSISAEKIRAGDFKTPPIKELKEQSNFAANDDDDIDVPF